MQEAITNGQVVEFRQEIRRLLQNRILEAVEAVRAEELRQALGFAARAAYDVFLSKWSKLCPAVARSLAGYEDCESYGFGRA